MSEQHYLVRTLYLANYVEAAQNVARLRRNPSDADSLRTVLKRLELADKMLEDELNAFASRGYSLSELIKHEVPDYPGDLLITIVFERAQQP
jgi:hypothetical protein